MPRKNDWEIRFGAARRAKDRAYLAEAEAAIALEEKSATPEPKNPRPPSAGFPEAPDAIDFNNEAAKRIARAFGRKVL